MLCWVVKSILEKRSTLSTRSTEAVFNNNRIWSIEDMSAWEGFDDSRGHQKDPHLSRRERFDLFNDQQREKERDRLQGC